MSDFKILAGVTTTVIVGIWTYYIFLAERTHSPRLEMEFKAECISFDKDFYLLTTKLNLENTSKVLLEPTSAQIKVQQVLPNLKDFNELSYDQFNELDEGDDQLLFPKLAQKDWHKQTAPIILEPGESEELGADFFLKKTAEVIRLYGSVANPVTKLYWIKTETLKVQDICRN